MAYEVGIDPNHVGRAPHKGSHICSENAG